MQVPRKKLFFLGLIVIASSVVFGIVTHYFPSYPIVGDGYIVTYLGEGKQEVLIVVSLLENETQWEGYIYLRAPYPDYPLRQYHALTYVFLAIGLAMLFYSLRMKWIISTKLRLSFHVDRIGALMRSGTTRRILIYLVIGLVIGLGIGYLAIPKG